MKIIVSDIYEYSVTGITGVIILKLLAKAYQADSISILGSSVL